MVGSGTPGMGPGFECGLEAIEAGSCNPTREFAYTGDRPSEELSQIFQMYRAFFLVLLIAVPSQSRVHADSPEVQYSRDVLPILAQHCFACHGFDEAAREAGLRLDIINEHSLDLIGPGEPDSSELIDRISSEDPDVVMPPPSTKKTLSDAQKAVLEEWVQQGAEYQTHWAFRIPESKTPPKREGVVHPIDRFIHGRLDEKNIEPSPRAPLATLIRRVSLDLTGLPPTVEQVHAFESEATSNFTAAWDALIQRLLDSPHYGERWARWWLDQARYADSNGYSIDAPRSIWKYRDWVIQAFNDDMPFDQFTVEQIAGDLLPEATVEQRVATGFHRNTQINQEGGIDREQFRIDSVFDRVATTGTVWLGLTVGCAQCHDHKFDPISQKEFYRLFAFFNNQDEPSIKVDDSSVDVEATQQILDARKSSLAELFEEHGTSLQAWEKSLTEDVRKKLPSIVQKALGVAAKKRNFDHRLSIFGASPQAELDAFKQLSADYQAAKESLANAPTTMILRERKTPRKSHVFIKGDFTRKGEEVFPGTPAVLHPLPESPNPNRLDLAPDRLDLARWIVSRQNPLTSRVIVNRVWQQYFGRGLVATENDFGLTGSPPTHPDLLDWLANHWVEQQWSLKALHRLIVTSSTYLQSSDIRSDLASIDADNLMLARQSRLRLDAELVRDVALVSSGLFSGKLGGPPVYPPIADGVMSQGQVKRGWPTSSGEDRYRRGMYTFVYRATPPPSLSVFDAPDGFSSCTRRTRSNTPLQSLALMNDKAFFECAEALESIIQKEGIATAFQRCTSRLPDDRERKILQGLDTITAARALLNLDETITRE